MSASQIELWDSRAGSHPVRDADEEPPLNGPDRTWSSGPPQGIAELVFHEYDFEACYRRVAARDAET